MERYRKRGILPGIILVALGILFLMGNYKIDIRSWLVLAIGVTFLVYYFIRKRTEFLILGLVLSYLGSIIFLKSTQLVSQDIFGPILLMLLGVIFLVIYFFKKIQWSIYPGLLLPAIGVYSYIITFDAINKSETWPLIFMNIAIAFLLIFILEFKRQGYKPLIVALMFFSLGVLAFLTTTGIIDKTIWLKLSMLFKNLWPIILIIVGILIMLKNSAFKSKE